MTEIFTDTDEITASNKWGKVVIRREWLHGRYVYWLDRIRDGGDYRHGTTYSNMEVALHDALEWLNGLRWVAEQKE